MSSHLPGHLKNATYSNSANTGLWYDKFFNKWTVTANDWKLDAPTKQKWINTVAAKPCGDRKLLAEHHKRITELTEQLGGGYRIYSNVYRFVSGLGREHPVENGFAWHHTLGTPFLPGSSVKGTLRAFLTTWANIPEAEITGIFGSRDSRTQHSVGSVVFLDAIPVAPPTLKADVMTPHYDPYYQNDEVPGDWHSPIPIPFLTVAPGAKFLFAVLPRTTAGADKADCEKILNWLSDALETSGAGAKTAIGYGRFRPVAATLAAPAQHPLFKEIDAATPQNAAQIVDKILVVSDAALKKQLAQKMSKKTGGREFRTARQKAAEKPGHWLNRLQKTSEQ